MARTYTETKTVYEFSELSDQAKNKFRWSQEYPFGDDIIATLEKALEHYNCTLKDYSIDWNNINGCSYKIEYKGNYHEVEELSGIRLWKYINNNFMTYYCKYDKEIKLVLDGYCPFTGVCHDEDFLDNIREFMKNPNGQTFEDLINDSVYNCIKAGCDDYEYQQSDEALEEHCEANGYEFDENGNIA